MKNEKKILLIILVSLIIMLLAKFVFMNISCKCDCDNEKINNEMKDDKYLELINIFYDYLNSIYNTPEWMNGGIKPSSYKVTLGQLQEEGMDISMFVNPVTGEKCDLEKTYGRFVVLGELDNGKTDYIYDVELSCEGETPTE